MIKKLSALLTAFALCGAALIPAHAEDASTVLTPVYSLGDINGDGDITAADASEILLEVAMIGAGSETHFSGEQSDAADLDGDGTISAADAAFVLTYVSVAGTGSRRTVDDFMYQQLLPVRADALPEFSGEPYTIVNDGEPFFVVSDYDVSESFEDYSTLDSLGRCRIAVANIGQDIMPTECRGDISSVKPTGWQSVTYDIVEGGSLYNRSHLIGFQLAGENANPLNLITGTRYMNATGMLPFENQIASYVKSTDCHVLYRVTPVFEDDNLVASGVLMEAWSVEDNGEGICFNVYCYNVQPGIVIDYASGDNWLESESEVETTITLPETTCFETVTTGPVSETTAATVTTMPQTTTATSSATVTTSTTTVTTTTTTTTAADGLCRVDQNAAAYIVNTNTKKFHSPDCSEVSKIKTENSAPVSNSKEELEALGYAGCKRCNP